MDTRTIRRRLRRGTAGAVGLSVTAAMGIGGNAFAQSAAPPATNPQVAAVQGDWGLQLMSAQDRADCTGTFTPYDSSAAFDTFRESKETYVGGFSSSDPRFSGYSFFSAAFYLHMVREVSPGVTGDNGAVDGTYALFDQNGLAIAQGNIEGVTHSNAQAELSITPVPQNEDFVGLLYGGQVLRPSGATIGRPHLVANFEARFLASGGNHTDTLGDFGGTDSGTLRPAVVVGGSCPGAYKVRPVVVQPVSATRSATVAASPALKAREAAYVQSLYERGGH